MTSAAAPFSNNVPILLLPPSEGKAEGGIDAAWEPSEGAFGIPLSAARMTVASALARSKGGDERMLGVRGAAFDRGQAANRTLIGAPTMPAWQRYTGVVWTALDPASVGAVNRRRIIVVSGLLGLVRGDDPVPDYRLKMAASLPPLGKLSTWWRDDASAALVTTAKRSRPRRMVIDLLPLEHRAALDPDALAESHAVRVDLVTADGRAGGHGGKTAKGELARALLTEGVAALDTWEHPNYHLDVNEL
ncbi:MAG: peroxide stress protein YaaA [Actinomycetota bacterium]